MPTAVTERETASTLYEHQRVEAVFVDARQVLDPRGLLRDYAHQRAAERLAGGRIDTLYKDPFAQNDALGAARLLCAARDAKLPIGPLQENLDREVRTGLVEVLMAEAHVATTYIDINADGRPHLGSIMFDDMVLRGIHPDSPDCLNTYGEIDYYNELISRAHFADQALRRSHARVTLSPIPFDLEPNPDRLRDYKFRLGNKAWIIDWCEFVPKGAGQQRMTQRLFMSNSDLALQNRLLLQLGITDGWHSSAAMRARSVLVDKTAMPGGPAALGRMADQLTHQTTSQPAFCGQPRDKAPDRAEYDHLPKESARREAEVDHHVAILGDVALWLAGHTYLTFAEQNQYYGNAIIYALRDICARKPEYAEYAFGKNAAANYQEAKDLSEAGDFAGAAAALIKAHDESKTALICNMLVQLQDGDEETSPFASLEQKYGLDGVTHGVCQACGARGKVRKNCGRVCNSCDTKDRLAPGYLNEIQKQKQRRKQSGGSVLRLLSGGVEHRATLSGRPAAFGGKAPARAYGRHADG